MNEAPQFHYRIISDGHFRATVPNGIALDRLVREALSQGRPVKIELREEPLAYAVTRHWKDNHDDFQVLEYFASEAECRAFIRRQSHDSRYRYEVSSWVDEQS